MEHEIVIRAEGVGKMYNVKVGNAPRYETLRETLSAKMKRVLDRVSKGNDISNRSSIGEGFWSLRDVSFDVRQGEVLGIIGRNGAGKSTLLKILSRITPPTTGRVEITGRVASLLEVGTGFHPELSGRENIFLNGSILGMSRASIVKSFDEIVEFSGVSDFIDLPVKRYSSGMHVRLAFAVAAHLDPDILILDEVLAVGDAAFQRKCVTKIDEIARSKNRTIILVSHGMGAITSMCDRAILLDHGRIVDSGAASAVVDRYYSSVSAATTEVDYSKSKRTVGDNFATLISATVEDDAGGTAGNIDIGQSFKLKMVYRLNTDVPTEPLPNFHFRNALGQIAFISSDRANVGTAPGVYEAVCCVPGSLMNGDAYVIDLGLTFLHNGVHVSFYEKSALTFNIIESPEAIEKDRNGYTGPIPGVVRPKLKWQFNRRAE